MNNKKRNAFCSYCFVMTKRVILSLLLVLCLLATCPAQSVTLTISNPTSAQRSELVAIDAATLGIEVGKGVVVRDVSNIERPTQWTHDGKLLMEVHVRPHGKAVFTLQPGTPAAFLSWVDGRQYPERWDDIAFENDRIGFRLYGPALQKHGEKGYGYDLWVKRTTELVLGELYRNDPRLSFHLDYGKGVDCFAVGPTLGPVALRDVQNTGQGSAAFHCAGRLPHNSRRHHRAPHPIARQRLELRREYCLV